MKTSDIQQLHFTLDSFLKKNQSLLSINSYVEGQEILEEINELTNKEIIDELVKNFILENLEFLIRKYIKNNSGGYDIGLFLSHIKNMEKYIHIELLDINKIHVILVICLHKILTRGAKGLFENDKLIIDNMKAYFKNDKESIYLNNIFKYAVLSKKTSLVDKLKNHINFDEFTSKTLDKNLIVNMKGIKLIEYLIKHEYKTNI